MSWNNIADEVRICYVVPTLLHHMGRSYVEEDVYEGGDVM
jgi:hypothetical protein